MNFFKNSLLTVRFITKALAANREKGAYHKLVKKMAADEIKRSVELNDGSLSDLHFLKIQWYMATTLYLGELLSELRQEKIRPDEKKSLIYMGALIAITDLMVDDLRLPYEKITQLMTDEKERERNDLSSVEHILLLYYRKLLTVINDHKKRIIHDFSLLKPQIDSREQMTAAISENKVTEQTRKKGGSALLLIAALLFEVDEKRRVAFYQLGAFIQFMNDAQDMPKDLKNGITTFVRFQPSYESIRKFLVEEFEKTATLISGDGFPEKGVYRLLFGLNGLLTGIEYKILRYAQITHDRPDSEVILSTNTSKFRIRMFSFGSIRYCLPKMISYKDMPHRP